MMPDEPHSTLDTRGAEGVPSEPRDQLRRFAAERGPAWPDDTIEDVRAKEAIWSSLVRERSPLDVAVECRDLIVERVLEDDPFVLETLVQIANCWRRLNRPEKARGAVEQAQLTLDRLPQDADFLATTNFTRQQWQQLLDDMSRW